MDAAYMLPTQCKVSMFRRKEITDHQLTIMRTLFIKTREADPHYHMKAKQRSRSVEQYLLEKFAKSIDGKEDHLYFFLLTSASSSFFLSLSSTSSSSPSDSNQRDLIGFTMAERVNPTSIYVSRTTVDPRVQNAGLGKALAGTLKEYFEHEVIWGLVNKKQVGVRRFWEVLGAKVTPAAALQVRPFKDYVIYAYRAKL